MGWKEGEDWILTDNYMNNNVFNKFERKHHGISSTTLNRYESAVDANINPSIIEELKLNVAQMDVFNRLALLFGIIAILIYSTITCPFSIYCGWTILLAYPPWLNTSMQANGIMVV